MPVRDKTRYLLYETTLSAGEARDKAFEGCLRFLGELGFARAGIKAVVGEGKLALKCKVESVDEVIAALAFEEGFELKRVSGTLKELGWRRVGETREGLP